MMIHGDHECFSVTALKLEPGNFNAFTFKVISTMGYTTLYLWPLPEAFLCLKQLVQAVAAPCGYKHAAKTQQFSAAHATFDRVRL